MAALFPSRSKPTTKDDHKLHGEKDGVVRLSDFREEEGSRQVKKRKIVCISDDSDDDEVRL